MTTPLPEEVQYITPKEAATILRVEYKTITKMIKKGQLLAYKCGRVWRIYKPSLVDPSIAAFYSKPIDQATNENAGDLLWHSTREGKKEFITLDSRILKEKDSEYNKVLGLQTK